MAKSKLKSVVVKLGLPSIGEVEGTWEPDESQRQAAWEMYVELVTRISVEELRPDEGSLREALSSIYSLFNTTREILRKYGPSVARPGVEGNLSFGYLSVAILNTVLRPTLSTWHPLLLDHESRKESTVSPIEHERKWDKSVELRGDLNKVRAILTVYANVLAQVAEVPPLILQAAGMND